MLLGCCFSAKDGNRIQRIMLKFPDKQRDDVHVQIAALNVLLILTLKTIQPLHVDVSQASIFR